MRTPIYKYNVDRYLSSYEDVIKDIINSKGLIELEAPTGSGKTHTILEIYKKEAEINKDTVYVIACPNRVQNIQNGEKEWVYGLVGGVKLNYSTRIISAVYEKVPEIVEFFEGYKIVLVIDEAHQLLDSVKYRKNTIDKLEEASQKCQTVIHLTATDRKLRSFEGYKYNKIYSFKANNNKNINNFKIMRYTDKNASLFSIIRFNQLKNKKSLVFVSGDKSNIEALKFVLEDKDLKVGIVTSDTKYDEVFESISSKSIIPSEYDVVLASSVLDCGTNIKNTEEIVAIELVTEVSHFSLDSTEQRFARLRNKQNEAYLLIPTYEAPESILKPFEMVKDELYSNVKKSYNEILDLRQYYINKEYTPEEVEETIKLNLKGGICYGFGVIEMVEGYPEVNPKRLLNEAYNRFDKQLLDPKFEFQLLESLQSRIKSENIKVVSENFNDEDVETRDTLKAAKKDIKDKVKSNNEEARNKIISLSKDIYLNEYLLSEDKHQTLLLIKETSENAYADIRFIVKEEKELKKIKSLMDIPELKENFEVLIAIYQKLEKKSDLDLFIKKYIYIESNKKIGDIFIVKNSSTYGIIRKELDRMAIKKSVLTDKKLIELYEVLCKCGKAKTLLGSRLYKEFNEEADKSKRKKIFQEKVKCKLLSEISLIYKLSDHVNGKQFSSLIKDFKELRDSLEL